VRKLVPINNPLSQASQTQEMFSRSRGKPTDRQDNMVSTENILFIMGGSFERPPANKKNTSDISLFVRTGSLAPIGSIAGCRSNTL
jgi:hypothetical protein